MSVAKKLAELISEGGQSKTSPYATTGTVKRIEGKTAYVAFDGGSIETLLEEFLETFPLLFGGIIQRTPAKSISGEVESTLEVVV
jgi:hypothetical protein